jgi:hypothetical protein
MLQFHRDIIKLSNGPWWRRFLLIVLKWANKKLRCIKYPKNIQQSKQEGLKVEEIPLDNTLDGPVRNFVASTRVEIAHLGIGLDLSKGRVISVGESCKVSPSSSLNNGVELSRASKISR